MDIVTITLNPALDLTTRLEVMHPGEVNLVSEANLRAAGKGINVAMVLKDLGRDVGLTGWLGEGNQQSFVSLFEERALADHFVRVAGDTRINVKISEQSGRVTDLNLPGLAVQEGDVSALEAALERLAPHTDWFVLAGSLPKGVSPDYCGHLIRLLKAKGKQVIFDCSGAALSEGIKAAPTLVKPNLEELSQWAGRPVKTLSEQAECARALQASGIPNVVISNGADGLIWFAPDATWQAIPPRMEVVSTVGAGDSLVAGLVHGMSLDWTPEQTLRLATAVSALAVSQVAVGFNDINVLKPLLEQVRVQRLDDLAPTQPQPHLMANSGDAQ
ncbi:1-phosphofructokinase [Aeromonas caviae]|jgi:1-phosphofructokinase|uniref:1-phosphofructokinase n=1 Tax=Aeromonas caviae TaxID=648 RepID=UPI001EEF9922|nr:1-phosphofructokinase [Aeromonas caviae]ULH03389.1 1-phosphofructokinase [Aeromonas caviae]WDV30106.1 1-phosphofructokinase [Aeromonas caviae]